MIKGLSLRVRSWSYSEVFEVGADFDEWRAFHYFNVSGRML